MSQLTLNLNLQPTRKAWTVSELTAKIRDLLAKSFTDITVQGESPTAAKPSLATSISL